MQGTTLSRRSLTKGAIWSVPAIAVSSAAPALAASQMPVTMLWSGFPRSSISRRLNSPATQTVGGVAVTTSLTRSDPIHVNDNWTSTSDGRLKLASNRVTSGSSEQIVTLDFAAPVRNVSLTSRIWTVAAILTIRTRSSSPLGEPPSPLPLLGER